MRQFCPVCRCKHASQGLLASGIGSDWVLGSREGHRSRRPASEFEPLHGRPRRRVNRQRCSRTRAPQLRPDSLLTTQHPTKTSSPPHRNLGPPQRNLGVDQNPLLRIVDVYYTKERDLVGVTDAEIIVSDGDEVELGCGDPDFVSARGGFFLAIHASLRQPSE